MKKYLSLIAMISFSNSLLSMLLVEECQPDPSRYNFNHPTVYDYYDATNDVVTLLKDITPQNAEDKIKLIKMVLHDDTLNSKFSKQVKTYLVKQLRRQVYSYKRIEEAGHVPGQLTTYFDGLQETCSFLTDDLLPSASLDADKSPWLQLTLQELLRKYCLIVHSKRQGKDYPREAA